MSRPRGRDRCVRVLVGSSGGVGGDVRVSRRRFASPRDLRRPEHLVVDDGSLPGGAAVTAHEVEVMDRQYGGWRTASCSNGNAECVEVGHAAETIAVRDSKDRLGTVLTIPAGAWQDRKSVV